MGTSSLIGSVGVTILLLAFMLNLLQKLKADSTAYLAMNVVGAGLACMSSIMISFWPFVVLEGVWAVASLVPLCKKVIA